MTTKQKKEVTQFIKETTICDILAHTWQVIGADVLTAIELDSKDSECWQVSACSVTMKQAEVIEVILDASYIEAHLSDYIEEAHLNDEGFQKDKTPDNTELVKKFRSLTRDQKKAIAKVAFPYKTVGWW